MELSQMPHEARSKSTVVTRTLHVLPDFFVVGPPRTGTSWLHEVLRRYASLPVHAKETRFFDLHFHRGFDWYGRYFPTPDNHPQPRGEIAATYFASAEARKRIAREIPHAKIVCVFRHPIERIVSLYRLKCAYGMVPWSFEDAVSRDPELVESGRYATHLRAWQLTIGAKQVLATRYDELRGAPKNYVDGVTDFLNLPRISLSESQVNFIHSSETLTHPRHFQFTRMAVQLANWLKVRHFDGLVAPMRNSRLRKVFFEGGEPFGSVSAEFSRYLLDLFRPEVEKLEEMLNWDLTAWKSLPRLSAERSLDDLPAENRNLESIGI